MELLAIELNSKTHQSVLPSNTIGSVRTLVEFCESPLAAAQHADALTVHLALTDATKHIVNDDILNAVNPGAYIINASRGEMVDEDALIRAMNERGLRAGLDVFDNEPTPSIHICMHNAISLTPHIGAATLEAQSRIGTELAEQISKIYNK